MQRLRSARCSNGTTSTSTGCSAYSWLSTAFPTFRPMWASFSLCWHSPPGLPCGLSGALLFGRIGDIVGRKYTFLVTMTRMGLGTFFIGVLPSSAQWGIMAPIVLIGLRLVQGLALSGEYGGAATTSPSTRLMASATFIPHGFKPPPRSAYSWHCCSSLPSATQWARRRLPTGDGGSRSCFRCCFSSFRSGSGQS
jgi:MFS family permease